MVAALADTVMAPWQIVEWGGGVVDYLSLIVSTLLALGITSGLMRMTRLMRDRDVIRQQEQQALRWRKTNSKDWEERAMRRVEPLKGMNDATL